MEIEARQEDRTYSLIAIFDEGFAAGWKMAVPDVFRDALDIKLTPRRYRGKTEMLWTQGKIYSFSEGDTFYDTKLAYQGKWGDALKVLQLAVTVTFSNRAGYVNFESIKTAEDKLTIVSQKGKSGPKEESISDGLQVHKQRIDYGLVRFKVFRPDAALSKLEEKEIMECTQDDFVAFLQTGVVRTKDNKQVNLVTG